MRRRYHLLGAGGFDAGNRSGDVAGQAFVALRGDEDVVFDADADATQLARGLCVGGGEVEARLDGHQVALADRRVVVVVVEDGGVFAGGDDRVIAPAPSTAAAEVPFQNGLQLVFVRAGAAGAHRREMASARQLDRLAQRVQL